MEVLCWTLWYNTIKKATKFSLKNEVDKKSHTCVNDEKTQNRDVWGHQNTRWKCRKRMEKIAANRQWEEETKGNLWFILFKTYIGINRKFKKNILK